MPGSLVFTSTATLTDDSADGVSVKLDGAGNAYVMWTTRDDVNPGLQRQVRLRYTKIPAGGGAPTTELLETYQTPSATSPTLAIAFDVNAAGDAAFVKFRSTNNTATTTITDEYWGWTRPAGGTDTTPELLTSASRTGNQGNPDTNGEAYLTSLNVGLNDARDVMASWFRGAFPFNTSSVDVVNGTVADGFGAIEHPPVADVTKIFYTSIPSVLDATGRTTLGASLNIGGKVRVQIFTRSRTGTWAGPQTPLPTGDHNYNPTFAADPSGRVMLVITPGASTYAIDTAMAEPGQAFDTPKLLVSGLSGLQRAMPAFGASGDGVLAWVFDQNAAYVTDAVGYDVSPPQLRSLTIPAAGTADSLLDFSVAPFDIWSPVTTTWIFDGVTSDGATQSHVFGDAGNKAVSVTATDTFGNAATANGSVDVAAAPVIAPPVVVPPTPARDTTAPAVSGFAFSPAAFAVGKKATPLVAKVVRGSTLKFTLSEAGAVTIKVVRELPGLRSGKRCVAPKKGKKGKKCTRLKTMGTLKRTGVAGANKIAFSGRLGKRALGVGRYRATFVVKDVAGNSPRPVVAKFRIIPAR
jgi:hypothetical protein